jgi:hypothetical protein
MIQRAHAPGILSIVNFGHGGTGAYSFLSWHRYFLYQFEKQLQIYVPGVMLPYWDWTDPVAAGILVDDFLGPNGTINNEVRTGYFAPIAPTPLPSWWPPGLSGWILPNSFGPGSGPLRRMLQPVSGLPDATDLHELLVMGTYAAFQVALEAGVGLSDHSQQMHNGLHGWVGGASTVGQMANVYFSPFDPIFYLHHCNIDRLWAMWQMDGHADEYPTSGGKVQHARNDIMYPWTGGAAGYSTVADIAPFIPMPDFSALGAKRNVDTLDFRNAFDYTYDSMPIIGLGLDRTGSMSGMTPDPMTTSSPDVTKWEAAKRGISEFLQDCETVQSSGIAYIMAGIKTFRRLAANDFATVFSSPGYGLIKNGSTFSRASFESNVAGMSPGGSTPLADALQDVQDTLVEPPFGSGPIDEQRYLAMLTDGLLTSGSPMSSIPDHSYSRTAVFAMGFGTGAEVDYTTLQSIKDKGKTLGTQQIFHGENAGTIDKFYSNSLAQAIGFSPIIDPVLELFAGEHAHIDFQATSAEDVFLITVQGMDFNSENWTIHLSGPGGYMAYGDVTGHSHASMEGHGTCLPQVTATRANGRLTMVLDRNNADYECWVGQWQLMVAYQARTMDAMVMPTIGELIIPVSAGPVQGPRFSKLLISPKKRQATRNLKIKPAHRLDVQAVSTNNSENEACSVVVNVYGRTRLKMNLLPQKDLVSDVSGFTVEISNDLIKGNVVSGRTFARLIAPINDVSALLRRAKGKQLRKEALLKGRDGLRYDPAIVLATIEKADSQVSNIRDEELQVMTDQDGNSQVQVPGTEIPGVYHLGVYVEGTYCPEHMHPEGNHSHSHGHAHGHGHVSDSDESSCGPECCLEGFVRILNSTTAVTNKKIVQSPKKKLRRRK